jgi:hypothetical protein
VKDDHWSLDCVCFARWLPGAVLKLVASNVLGEKNTILHKNSLQTITRPSILLCWDLARYAGNAPGVGRHLICIKPQAPPTWVVVGKFVSKIEKSSRPPFKFRLGGGCTATRIYPRTHDFGPNLQPPSKKSGQNDTAEPASSWLKSIYGWSLLPGDTTFATNFGQKVVALSIFYAN